MAGLPMANDADCVIASLYEAAALPELWKGALQSLADLTGSRGVVLSQANRDHAALICSANLDSTGAQFFEQGWNTRDFRTESFLRRLHGAGRQEAMLPFVADQDIISHEDMKASDYYRDFAHSAGVPWFCATGIRIVNGVVIGVALQRSESQGPFGNAELTRLNTLLPQLQRVMSLASRVAHQQHSAMMDALDWIDEAAILLDEKADIVGISRAGEAMIGTALRRQRNSIAAIDPACRAAFAAFIEAGCGSRARSGTMPAPLRLARANDTPVLAQLAPIVGQAQDVFGSANTLLLLSPVGQPVPVRAELLRAAFDLTPGEARVARLLTTGMGVKSIATTLAISESGVRFHIKAILSKNGFRRQAAFVAAAVAVNHSSAS